MKKLLLFAPMLLCIPAAYGQAAVDIGLGFGGAWDSANKTGIDDLTLGPCIATTATCDKTGSMNGFMLGFGGDIMFKEHFGGGFSYDVQPARQTYVTGTLNGGLQGGQLKSRQSFIDVNGIYEPIINKRFTVQLIGGIGDARTSLAYSQNTCAANVCSTVNQAFGNANHFDLHLGAGVQVAITEHIFVRPEFDYHYVPNLTDQFSSNSVPSFMVWVGYHFGGSH